MEKDKRHLPLERELNKLKGRVNFNIENTKIEEERNGMLIKWEIGNKISDFKKRNFDLPKSIDIEHRPDQGNETQREIIRYDLKTNELLLIKKTIKEDLSYRYAAKVIFRLPENEQKEKNMGTLENEEWLKYGPKVVDKLKELVLNPQGKINKKSK